MYIHEAHPSDGWQMEENVRENVVFAQPHSTAERRNVARSCCERLKLTMPCVTDDLDNRVDTLYAAWPERMYVIDEAGRIAYAGARGPWGFSPEDVERWLRQRR